MYSLDIPDKEVLLMKLYVVNFIYLCFCYTHIIIKRMIRSINENTESVDSQGLDS